MAACGSCRRTQGPRRTARYAPPRCAARAAQGEQQHKAAQLALFAPPVEARAHTPRSTPLTQDAPRPEPTNETLLINELLREYLAFNGMRETLSVFLPGAAGPV